MTFSASGLVLVGRAPVRRRRIRVPHIGEKSINRGGRRERRELNWFFCFLFQAASWCSTAQCSASSATSAVDALPVLGYRVYAGTSSVVVSRLRFDRAKPRTYLSAPGVLYFAAYASSTAAFVFSGTDVTARTRSSRPAT